MERRIRNRSGIRNRIKAVAEFLLGLLYPVRCPFCDEPVRRSEGRICIACRERLHFVEEPYCMKCGKPLREEQAEYCGDCLSRRHSYDRGRALLHYQGQVKRSVYRFKYAGRREYAKAYAELFAAQLGSFLQETGAQALVPVPLHRARQRKRGYNQAALLARELSRLTGIPVEEHLVVRRKNTIPQKQLDVTQRQNNLKKAFKMCQNDVKLKTIILIDDIYTTGSTMDALSALLKEHGAERVFFLALAVGE